MNWFVKKNSPSCQLSSKNAEILYSRVVEKIRDPRLYHDYGIEDSPQGRFELLSLHLFIFLRTLKERGGTDANQLSQDICNLFAADMDHSLRDIRVSEMKMARQYKKFIEGFYGRLVSYDTAIEAYYAQRNIPKEAPEPTVISNFVDAILKNVYNGDSSNKEYSEGLAEYGRTQLIHIRNLSQQNLMDIHFTT